MELRQRSKDVKILTSSQSTNCSQLDNVLTNSEVISLTDRNVAYKTKNYDYKKFIRKINLILNRKKNARIDDLQNIRQEILDYLKNQDILSTKSRNFINKKLKFIEELLNVKEEKQQIGCRLTRKLAKKISQETQQYRESSVIESNSSVSNSLINSYGSISTEEPLNLSYKDNSNSSWSISKIFKTNCTLESEKNENSKEIINTETLHLEKCGFSDTDLKEIKKDFDQRLNAFFQLYLIEKNDEQKFKSQEIDETLNLPETVPVQMQKPCKFEPFLSQPELSTRTCETKQNETIEKCLTQPEPSVYERTFEAFSNSPVIKFKIDNNEFDIKSKFSDEDFRSFESGVSPNFSVTGHLHNNESLITSGNKIYCTLTSTEVARLANALDLHVEYLKSQINLCKKNCKGNDDDLENISEIEASQSPVRHPALQRHVIINGNRNEKSN